MAGGTPESSVNLAKLASLSSELAEESTRLSKRLAEIERKLASMPGRTEFGCRFSVEQNHVEIHFERLRSLWRLTLWEPDPLSGEVQVRTIDTMSVEAKAALASCLPGFLKRMFDTQAKRTARVRSANTALDSAEKMLEGL